VEIHILVGQVVAAAHLFLAPMQQQRQHLAGLMTTPQCELAVLVVLLLLLEVRVLQTLAVAAAAAAHQLTAQHLVLAALAVQALCA